MISLKAVISAWILLSTLVPAITAQATTYYVATTGTDTHSCLQARSASTPKLTIPAGVKCLAGGDTLIIKAGTYVGQPIYNPPPGSPSAYTVIKGDPAGPRPVIDPQGELGNGHQAAFGLLCTTGSACRYIELRYVEITTAFNSVRLWGSDSTGYPHHMRFISNIFHDTIHTNVLISTSNTGFLGGDHLFQGNEFYRTGVGTPGYPPGFNTIYNPGNRSVVEQNTFHNLANGVGIWHKDKLIQNVIVRNNVFYDIGRSNTDTWQQGNGGFSAIHASVGGGGHQIYNNIIYRSGDEATLNAIRIQWSSATDVNHIYNNTIYDLKHPDARAVLIRSTEGTHYVKNNIAYLAGRGIVGGTQSHNLTDDPSFMDPENANFTLHSTSEAINTGTTLDLVSTDFAGTRRPVGGIYDIGAYEAGNGTNPLAPQNLAVR